MVNVRDGGTKKKPVGTVWIALGRKKNFEAQDFYFKGDRLQIREQAAYAALGMLRVRLAIL